MVLWTVCQTQRLNRRRLSRQLSQVSHGSHCLRTTIPTNTRGSIEDLLVGVGVMSVILPTHTAANPCAGKVHSIEGRCPVLASTVPEDSAIAEMEICTGKVLHLTEVLSSSVASANRSLSQQSTACSEQDLACCAGIDEQPQQQPHQPQFTQAQTQDVLAAIQRCMDFLKSPDA